MVRGQFLLSVIFIVLDQISERSNFGILEVLEVRLEIVLIVHVVYDAEGLFGVQYQRRRRYEFYIGSKVSTMLRYQLVSSNQFRIHLGFDLWVRIARIGFFPLLSWI